MFIFYLNVLWINNMTYLHSPVCESHKDSTVSPNFSSKESDNQMFKLIKFYVLKENLQNTIAQSSDKNIESHVRLRIPYLIEIYEIQVNGQSACSGYLVLHNTITPKMYWLKNNKYSIS